jgi:hypothetical protein
VLQWINADDLLLEGALTVIGQAHNGEAAIAGSVINFGAGKDVLLVNKGLTAIRLLEGSDDAVYHQPGIWFDSAKIRQLGPLPENMHFAFDWTYFILYLERWPVVRYVDEPLVKFRLHPYSKTVSHQPRFDAERKLGLKLIESYAASTSVRGAARRRDKLISWWEFVGSVQNDESTGRLGKILRIVYEAMRDPWQRVNRWTLGSIRRALLQVNR